MVDDLAQQLGQELLKQISRTATVLTGWIDEAEERALRRQGEQDAVVGALAQPERFGEAHRLVMRSLEMLDRDGHLDPGVRGFRPLNGLARLTVGFIAQFIIRISTRRA